MSERSGLFGSLKSLLRLSVDSVRTRLELLVLELTEERNRLMAILAYGAAAVVLLGLGLVLLIITLAVAFWEQKLLVLGLATALCLGGGGLCVLALQRRSQRPTQPFENTLDELRRDCEALKAAAKTSPTPPTDGGPEDPTGS